eukprot:SAG31_NODE_5284_length_2633_cov_1.219416_2_plen_267_part_00
MCAESDAGFDCTSSVTYTSARATCSSMGARLCTATELFIGEGQDTGCGYNGHLIWSSSRSLLLASPPLKCAPDERIVVGGIVNSQTPPICVATTAIHGPYGRPGLAVRCCADMECPDDAGPVPGLNLPNHDCKTCGELNWSTEQGDPEVCGESDDMMQCTSDVDYAHAAATCNSIGTRLCTAIELKLGEGRSTGCNHNRRMIWSSSTFLDLGLDHPLVCGDESERVIVSGSAVGTAAYHEPACSPISSSADIAVRCCADIECPSGH